MSKEKLEPTFPDGMFYKTSTIEWIDCVISIDKDKFLKWLQNQPQENIHIQLLTSKAGKKYFKSYSYPEKPTLKSKTIITDDTDEGSFWDE